MDHDWLTTLEAAELAGYTQRHVGLLAATGKIVAKKFGRDWHIDRLSFLNYLKAVEKIGAKRGPKAQA